MNILSIKEKTKILRALVEGCSIRSVERMTGHHRDTIMRLLVHAGLKAKEVMNTLIRNVPINSLQADELWTFVQRGVILTLGEVRSFIRKLYIHSSVSNDEQGRSKVSSQ